MFMSVQLCDSACMSVHANIPVCALAVCLHSPVCVCVCVCVCVFLSLSSYLLPNPAPHAPKSQY